MNKSKQNTTKKNCQIKTKQKATEAKPPPPTHGARFVLADYSCVQSLPVLVVVGKLSWTLLDKTDFSLLSRCQLQIISFLGMEFVSMSPSQPWDFVWFESVQTEFFDMGWWGIGQWI